MTTEQLIMLVIGSLISLLTWYHTSKLTEIVKKLENITDKFNEISQKVITIDLQCKEAKKDIDIIFKLYREQEKRMNEIEKICISKNGNCGK